MKLRPIPDEFRQRCVPLTIGVSAVSLAHFAPPGPARRDEGKGFEKRRADLGAQDLQVAGYFSHAILDQPRIERRRGAEHDGWCNRRRCLQNAIRVV